MTCIVALSDGEKVVVGCDTLAGQGDHSIELPSKLVVGEYAIIGGCGHARIITDLQKYFRFPVKREGGNLDDYVYSALIPAIKRFLEESNLLVGEDVEQKSVTHKETFYSKVRRKIFGGHKRTLNVEIKTPMYMAGNSQLLIASGSKIYVINSDLTLTERVGGFESIGSGRAYALGSLLTSKQSDLEPEVRVKWALSCAAKFSQGCAAPFKYVSTEKEVKQC